MKKVIKFDRDDSPYFKSRCKLSVRLRQRWALGGLGGVPPPRGLYPGGVNSRGGKILKNGKFTLDKMRFSLSWRGSKNGKGGVQCIVTHRRSSSCQYRSLEQ